MNNLSTANLRVPHSNGSASAKAEKLHSELSQARHSAEQLVEEMAAIWRKGERPLAEEFLARLPQASQQPDGAIRLIYGEICLRQEYGEEQSTTALVQRFPQFKAELEVLLDCHRLLQPLGDGPVFPKVGEVLGDFHLLAELGHGAQGRVFVATQPSLADRAVVLKMTPRFGQEHLALARLLHSHIVPLYLVQDFAARYLRVLCMPYLGGATLAQLLEALRARPVEQRSGQQLLDALDQAQAAVALTRTPGADAIRLASPARHYLARTSYVQAVCWIGVCLADALHYAHERGLVHLDLKPSNVLLAADGQPMLLDFHLAREPISPQDPAPQWLGGSLGYMSPEQRLALIAVRNGRPVPAAVDCTSDIYSLGMLLYEALGGTVPLDPEEVPLPLKRCNAQVSSGLTALIHKCLAHQPRDRYANAGALAQDLRLHLNHLPLTGVANRNLFERWHKWRRRRPHALRMAGTLLALAVMTLAAGTFGLVHVDQQLHHARTALVDGQKQLQNREYAAAVDTLSRGLAVADRLPGNRDLRGALADQLSVAERARAAQDLRLVADRLRFLDGSERVSRAVFEELDIRCQRLWDQRKMILGPEEGKASGLAPTTEVEQPIRSDLLDCAILWSDLRVRLAQDKDAEQTRQQALGVLAEAEALLGSSPVLDRERQDYAQFLGLKDLAALAKRRTAEQVPVTAWEHRTLGQFLLRSGDLTLARAEFERSLNMRPQDFWANFYRGICAYRLREYGDAVTAFQVCVALVPQNAECFYNRALAYAALGQSDRALRDYDRALMLNPSLAVAFLNRGILHYHGKRYHEAIADLQRALQCGAEPAAVHYNLALTHLAGENHTAAKASLRAALCHDPGHKEARELQNRFPLRP